MSFKIKAKNINFIYAYKHNNKISIFSKASFRTVCSLLVISLIFASIYAYIGYQNMQVKKELDTLYDYTNNSDNLMLYEQAIKNGTEANALLLQKNILISAQKELDSVALFNEIDFDAFLACSGNVTIGNIIYNNVKSSLSFDANTLSAETIKIYLDKLKNTGLFSNIEYFGYEKLNNFNYSFSITCYLKAVNK